MSMKTVRAKFKVAEINTKQISSTYSQITIVLRPEYDMKLAEDLSFSKATPSGEIKIQIDNPTAIELMPIGKLFYVDFIPIE